MQRDLSTIDVLIPAHNEEQALPAVLAELPWQFLRRVIVVDNASTDRTAAIARDLGCQVVYCAQPGYGAACLAGLAAMAADPPAIVVFLDGDHSDYPHHLPDLVGPIQAGSADFVLGSRRLGQAQRGSLTLPQRFGNALATRLMALFWGTTYTDLGPFRAITWSALQQLAMADTNFGWTIEMQIKAHLAALRTLELPVNYRCRIGVSKISGTVKGVFGAGYKILYTIFKYRFRLNQRVVENARSS